MDPQVADVLPDIVSLLQFFASASSLPPDQQAALSRLQAQVVALIPTVPNNKLIVPPH